MFMEPAYSCDIIHGHFSVTWPPVYLESWATISHLVLIFLYKFILPPYVGQPEVGGVDHALEFSSDS
jgi:hypothetical protein